MNEMRQQFSKCGACKLYHKQVFLPQELVKEVIEIMKQPKHFKFSNHLKNSKREHDLKQINEYLKIILSGVKVGRDISIFEVETQFGEITKFCIRLNLEYADNPIFVFTPSKNEVLIKTVWYNKKNDIHKTLRVDMYEKEGQ